MTELRAQIYGQVQAVSFRDFVERKAQERGLVGYVKNLPDGSVEVVAQGQKDELEKFISLLKEGSPLAQVERVEVEWRVSEKTYEAFAIVY